MLTPRPKRGGEEGYNNVASAMFRFATSGNFTPNLAGENAGLIARALSSFKGRIKEHLLVVVNTENMNAQNALLLQERDITWMPQKRQLEELMQ